MLYINKIYRSLLFIIILCSCASISPPEGEDPDKIPPKIITETPKNFSTNFEEKKIEVEFDEFIVTKDIRKQLIISPPLKNFPNIKPAGSARKKLTIEIEDTLKDNTTYSFNFGNSIQDFNEGNPYNQYKYVFSTGEFIDSLSISAEIKDAFSKNLDKDIYLMLYEIDSSFSDSTIIKEKPSYISNFLDSNITSIKNIKEGRYMLLAIKDNGNLKYDIKVDKIAFLNDIVDLKNNDTSLFFKLNIFSAIPPFKFLRATHTENGRINFFAEGKSKSFKVEKNYPLLVNLEEKNIIKEENFNKIDSLIEFFEYSVSNDTIKFNFNYITDSISFFIYNENKIIDTVFIKPKIRKESRKFELNPLQKGNLHLTEKLSISTNYPIRNIDKKFIKIIDKDSNNVDFKIHLDTNSRLKFLVDFNVEPEKKYMVSFFDNSIISIFNDTIKDTSNIILSTNKISSYGNLKLILTNKNISDDTQIIIEITDVKGEKIIRRDIIKSSQKDINFNLLSPNNVIIRLILDENNNGIWDTGDFFSRKQPEKVKYHDIIEIKAFWDIEQEWEVNWDL